MIVLFFDWIMMIGNELDASEFTEDLLYITFYEQTRPSLYDLYFSNSLIIHLVKTKETRTVTEFGNLI